MADRGHRITVVVEPLEPPELFEWFAELRASLGMTVVPLGPGAGATVLRALRANQVVCLLSDRDLGGGGVAGRVLRRAHHAAGRSGHAGAAHRGARCCPTAVYFTGGRDGHFGVVRPPLVARAHRPVPRRRRRASPRRSPTELEGLIRRAPEQWHLFQPNWPSDPGYEGKTS